jgi:hypothetical protein
VSPSLYCVASGSWFIVVYSTPIVNVIFILTEQGSNMYDFDVESIEDLRDFLDRNRDVVLKKNRDVLSFAIKDWSLQGVYDALQRIQNRPSHYNYDAVRAQILTWWLFHQKEVADIKVALLNTSHDMPVVVCRVINLVACLEQIERKYKR